MTEPPTTLSPFVPDPRRAALRLRRLLRSADVSRQDLVRALRTVPGFARELERLGAGLRRNADSDGGLEAAVLCLGQAKLAARFDAWLRRQVPRLKAPPAA